MIPKQDYIMVNIDLSQAENRIVAYIAPELKMIDAFKNNKDIHSITAGFVLDKKPDTISREDGSCHLGNGEHSERYFGKIANHSLNYDFGYKKFALKYQLPEAQAKMLKEKHYFNYPGIRDYHNWIKHKLVTERCLTNLYGRKRFFLEPPGDELYKKGYAQIPQSTVADKLCEVLNWVYVNPNMPELELLLQVHDSIMFQLPVKIGWEKIARYLLLIRQFMERPMEWHTRKFSIPVDCEVGLSWGSLVDVEIQTNNTTDNLAPKLEEIYVNARNKRLA